MFLREMRFAVPLTLLPARQGNIIISECTHGGGYSFYDILTSSLHSLKSASKAADRGGCAEAPPASRQSTAIFVSLTTRSDMDVLTHLKYEYEPLDEGNIRILVLHPGSGDDQIYCRLVRISLESTPGYDALSYVWGDASQRRKVICNNRFVE